MQRTLDRKPIKILYWNAKSILQRREEVQSIINDLDILICVESWLTPDVNIHYTGFTTFRRDRTHTRGGGIVIFIRNNIAFVEIVNLYSPDQSVEICGIHLNNIEPPLDILACYRSPGHVLSQHQWDDVIQNMQTGNCIFMGDFNAHHTNWNCRTSDGNGCKLVNAIDKHDIFLHNTDSSSYIDVHRNIKSNLDLILSSINISDKIDVKVSDETWGSDHFPIYINVDSTKLQYKKKSFKIKSLRTDWAKFQIALENCFTDFLSDEYENLSPSSKYDTLVKHIWQSVKMCTPRQKTPPNQAVIKNPVPWWDSDCDKAKRLRKASFKKWEFTKNPADLLSYKKSCAIVKRTFKQKKRDCFKKFAESINFRTNTNFVWNKCKTFKNSWVNVKPQFSTQNHQSKTKIEEALHKICPPWVQTDPSWIPPAEPNSFFDRQFDFAELNLALGKKNTKSACGMDGVDFEIIKNLPIKYKLLLLDIYNSMYSQNNYPLSWKQSFMHFIKKADGTNFRPISLTSCLGKLFETLIKNRLEWWAESHNLIPPSQHGFRRGKSCIDNLVQLTLKVDEAFVEKKEVLAAFLDVHGAFDNVNIDILLSKLSSLGCSPNLLTFVKFITHERFISTDHTGDTISLAHKGVPQGGVLSPLLYILYVANVTENLPKSVMISQFADDIAIYIKFASFGRGKKILERAINTLAKNLHDLGLDLTPNKTTLLHFNNKNIIPGNTEIVIQNHTIQSSESARFLGVIFDHKLSFVPQIDQINKRCAKSLNIIKYLCGTWWGSDPETLLILYKSLVRSIIDYGIFVYFPKRKNIAYKLEKIQYVAIRSALGYRKTTPTNILLAESKLTQIKDRASYLANCFLAKTFSNNNIATQKALNCYSNICRRKNYKRQRLICECITSYSNLANEIDTIKNHNIYTYDFVTHTTEIPIDTKLGQDLKYSLNPLLTFNNFLENSDAIALYTDGSKVLGAKRVGSACVSPALNVHVKRSMNNNASVFTAECVALSDAVNIAITLSNTNIHIFSDSLSALQSLQFTSFNSKTNFYVLEIKEKYNQFLRKNPNSSIKFFWIPSHIGIRGNEDADQLAKSATTCDTLDITAIPFTDLFEMFKKSANTLTTNHIKDQGLLKGKVYFESMHSNHSKPWFTHKNLPRELIVSINRARSDHYNLAASLARVCIIDNATCQCNEEDENLNHVIWQCKIYNSQRENLINKLNRLKMHLPLNIIPIIAKPDIKPCIVIFSYLKDCNLQV